MTEVRAEIDRVDKALVDIIAERFGYVERAWQLKLEARQEANVPWRNQQVIDKVRARRREGRAGGPVRGAVAADDRLVHPVRGGEAAPQNRGPTELMRPVCGKVPALRAHTLHVRCGGDDGWGGGRDDRWERA